MTTDTNTGPSITERYNNFAKLIRVLSPEDYTKYPVSQRGRVSEDNDLKKFIRELPEGQSFELPGVYVVDKPKINGGLQLYITNYAKSLGMRVKTKKNENKTDLAIYKLTEAEIDALVVAAAEKKELEDSLASVGVDAGESSEEEESTEENEESTEDNEESTEENED